MTSDEAKICILQARDLLDEVGECYEDANERIHDLVIESADNCDMMLEEFDWLRMRQKIEEEE